jgi:septal ring factor EnvC (AmiA/AmiB activator)
LKTLNAEIANSKTKLAELETALKDAEAQRAAPRYDVRPLDGAIANAEKESRGSIYQSQLHAYAAMLFQKAAQDVTDGNVKALEWYLIVIPSIAAAFSSTLIAMTAVRRIKRPIARTTAIPDEAAAYLFGPLVAAIRAEAREAVKTAASAEKQSL